MALFLWALGDVLSGSWGGFDVRRNRKGCRSHDVDQPDDDFPAAHNTLDRPRPFKRSPESLFPMAKERMLAWTWQTCVRYPGLQLYPFT